VLELATLLDGAALLVGAALLEVTTLLVALAGDASDVGALVGAADDGLCTVTNPVEAQEVELVGAAAPEFTGESPVG